MSRSRRYYIVRGIVRVVFWTVLLAGLLIVLSLWHDLAYRIT